MRKSWNLITSENWLFITMTFRYPAKILLVVFAIWPGFADMVIKIWSSRGREDWDTSWSLAKKQSVTRHTELCKVSLTTKLRRTVNVGNFGAASHNVLSDHDLGLSLPRSAASLSLVGATRTFKVPFHYRRLIIPSSNWWSRVLNGTARARGVGYMGLLDACQWRTDSEVLAAL